MEWPELPTILIFHLSLLVKWDMLRFYFKSTLNVYKIRNGKSKIWTSKYLHLGEKLYPHLCFPGSVWISYRNSDTFYCVQSRMKNCSLKVLCIVPYSWQKWGTVAAWWAFPSSTSCMHREWSEQRLICSWIQFSWKQCLEEWWLAETLAVLLSTCLSLQVSKLLYLCFYLGDSRSR